MDFVMLTPEEYAAHEDQKATSSLAFYSKVLSADPASDLALLSRVPLIPPGLAADPTETAAGLRADMSYEQWYAWGQTLQAVEKRINWYLADWLAFGLERFPGKYQQAVLVTGQQYQTLKNGAWIARAIPPERRRGSLTFSHHAEVASLPASAQETLLAICETGGLTCRELREKVREFKRTLNGLTEETAMPGAEVVCYANPRSLFDVVTKYLTREQQQELHLFLTAYLDRLRDAEFSENAEFPELENSSKQESFSGEEVDPLE